MSESNETKLRAAPDDYVCDSIIAAVQKQFGGLTDSSDKVRLAKRRTDAHAGIRAVLAPSIGTSGDQAPSDAENDALREYEAAVTLVEDGWTWDGDQWQRPGGYGAKAAEPSELRMALSRFEDVVTRRACGDLSKASVDEMRDDILARWGAPQPAAEPVMPKGCPASDYAPDFEVFDAGQLADFGRQQFSAGHAAALAAPQLVERKAQSVSDNRAVAALDARADSSYAAGLLAGWNFCDADDHAGYAHAREQYFASAATLRAESRSASQAHGKSEAVAYPALSLLPDTKAMYALRVFLDSADRMDLTQEALIEAVHIFGMASAQRPVAPAAEAAVVAGPAKDVTPLLRRLKQSLMRQRLSGPETVSAWARACTNAEGEIEEWLAAAPTSNQGGAA